MARLDRCGRKPLAIAKGGVDCPSPSTLDIVYDLPLVFWFVQGGAAIWLTLVAWYAFFFKATPRLLVGAAGLSNF